jgi:hypothetical protein
VSSPVALDGPAGTTEEGVGAGIKAEGGIVTGAAGEVGGDAACAPVVLTDTAVEDVGATICGKYDTDTLVSAVTPTFTVPVP